MSGTKSETLQLISPYSGDTAMFNYQSDVKTQVIYDTKIGLIFKT